MLGEVEFASIAYKNAVMIKESITGFSLLLLNPALVSAADGLLSKPVKLEAPFPSAKKSGGGSRASPLRKAKTEIAPFKTSPFPYRGMIPGKGKPFLDVADGERHGHTAPRGGIYWEDGAYNDRRVLLHIPQGFDPGRPAVLIVYFHGNLARLERDVRDRQQIPKQVAESGLNAVLVAPQFAVDASDSSAGRFWEPGQFARFLDEAEDRLTHLLGAQSAGRRFHHLPVILVAYSGGYLPAAYALHVGGATERVCGIVLLDALYSDEEKFAAWIAKRRKSTFFFSAYGPSSQENNAALQRQLANRQVEFQTTIPAKLVPGSVTFLSTGAEVSHNDFMTRAWVEHPLTSVLSRISAFSRAPHARTSRSNSAKSPPSR